MSTLTARDEACSAAERTRTRSAAAASGFAIVLLVVLGAACNTPRWDEPVAAYESFVRAARKGELETAWGALSSESRALITQRAAEMKEASGGSLGEDPKQLVFGARTRPEPAGVVQLLSMEGDRATVQVGQGEEAVAVRMVREDGRWHVDLLEALGDR